MMDNGFAGLPAAATQEVFRERQGSEAVTAPHERRAVLPGGPLLWAFSPSAPEWAPPGLGPQPPNRTASDRCAFTTD